MNAKGCNTVAEQLVEKVLEDLMLKLDEIHPLRVLLKAAAAVGVKEGWDRGYKAGKGVQ